MIFIIIKNKLYKMSQHFCIVQNCRFPETHLACSHKCGTCGKFGHGFMECGNQLAINNLKLQTIIYFPNHLHCTSSACPCPWTHSDLAHYCTQCRGRHLEKDCNIGGVIMRKQNVIMRKQNEINDVIKEAKEKFGSTPGKIFTTVYSGLGSSWFVKRNEINKPIEIFFMHTEAWGQYGPHCDDRDKLKKFCNGYLNLESGKFLEI